MRISYWIEVDNRVSILLPFLDRYFYKNLKKKFHSLFLFIIQIFDQTVKTRQVFMNLNLLIFIDNMGI